MEISAITAAQPGLAIKNSKKKDLIRINFCRNSHDTVTHVQVMPGATLKYELITDELCLTAASVGGECECKTLADSE